MGTETGTEERPASRSCGKKRWVVFDVGNTLVYDTESSRKAIDDLMTESGVDIHTPDYRETYQRITNEVFAYEQISPFVTIEHLHRKRLHQLYAWYHLDRDVTDDMHYVMLVKGDCELYPDVETIITQLSETWHIALLSNADDDDPAIRYLVKRFGFDCVVTSEAAHAYKPDPKVFQYFLEQSGAHKHDIFYIGDHQTADILGGKQFGIRVIWMNRTDERLQANIPIPDYEIRDLEELLVILAKV